MMKFEIKNRYTGKVQFVAEIDAEESTPSSVKKGLCVLWAHKAGADLRGVCLRGAELRRADLRGVCLRDADLRRADLRGAYLRDADLRYADLGDVDLWGADLRGADLRYTDLGDVDLWGADLGGAYLRDANFDLSDVPKIEDIHKKIAAAVDGGNKLEMDSYHTCETTHCRAGWAIHLAGKDGYELERKVGSFMAGLLIYLKSDPDYPVPDFFASNDDALESILEAASKIKESRVEE